MPAPNYSYTSVAPAADDVQAWERFTNGYHMSGPQGVNIMASPQEWGDIAKWYQDTLRTRHPRHFRLEDFLIIRERQERHRERNGDLSDMKITIFEEYTEVQLSQLWPKVFSMDRRQNRVIEYRKDMQLFKRACFWVKQVYAFTMTTPYAPLHALFGWDPTRPWLTDVNFIDYIYKDLRKGQLFTHPDKIHNTPVADHWPADDLSDSVKFMSSEMSYLKAVRTRILDEAATAPPGPGPRPANAISVIVIDKRRKPRDYTKGTAT
eukprot:5673270-Amphidinium_carterae.1